MSIEISSPKADWPDAGPSVVVAAPEQHFATDHLLVNLKARTVSSGFVTASSQAAKFLLTVGSTMVLARLLTPRDFGLVAMVSTVVGFLRVFKDAGLSIATVQRQRITQAQVSNLFWINIGVSLLGGLLLVGAAWPIAAFYHNSRLIPIALLLSITFVFNGSTVQHQALLKRQMRFKALAVIEIGSIACSITVAITLATLGYGYWALVWSMLSTEIAGLLLTWSISRWRPQLPTRRSGVGPLVSFGIHRTAGDLTLALARGSDMLLIGRFYGAAAVGLYSRGSALLLRPLEQFLNPINVVFIPALSRLQSQPKRYRSTFLRLYEAIALSSFFFTGLCLALAHPITIVLLGRKWEQASFIFAGFTLAALCLPLATTSAWLFISQGRGRDMFYTQLVNSFAILVSFLIALPFGPVAMAIAFSLSNLLVRIPLYYYRAGRQGPVATRDLWRVFFTHLPVWVLVFVTTSLALVLTRDFAPLAQLFICTPVGLAVGAAFVYSFKPQRQIANYVFNSVRDLIRPINEK
jgi:O-antigen/teichoic acid export membrane protein